MATSLAIKNMIQQPKPYKLEPKNLQPDSLNGRTFTSFFSYGFNWIYSPSEKISWHTEIRYPLTPRTLWDKWQDKKQIIGVRFGKLTEYAMIDIDRKSPYHPFNSISGFDSILKALESIGLNKCIVVRSSGSEGIHLYYPLEYSVSTFSLACAIRQALTEHRLEIASGTLETFPNTKSFDCEYNAHRLPLQNGSYVLRDDFIPLHNQVDRFIDTWLDIAEHQDLELLLDKMAIAKELYKPRYANNAKLNDWRQELETIMATGWQGSGETNQIIFKVCEYARVFLGYSELTQIVNWVTDKVTQLKGFKEHCNHQTDLLRRVRDWSKWILDHRFPMQSKQAKEQITVKKRETQREATLQRIKDSANSIHDRGINDLSIRAIAQTIAKQAGCSIKTLYNHLSLWHPEHRNAVTANSIDNTAELEAVIQYQETAKSESQSTVTQDPYEVLERDSNNAISLKFVASGFQPLPTAVKPTQAPPQNGEAPHKNPSQNKAFFDGIKIKLLEAKIANRQQGRIDASVLLEIEALKREIELIKNQI